MAVWPLPRITFRELSSIDEPRPVALLTSDELWAVLSTQLTLPVMIQAEPARYDRELFTYLAENLPSQVEAVYAVGNGAPVEAGKLIAAYNDVPLIIVPTALDSLRMLQPVAEMLDLEADEHVVETEETGPATEIIIDWGVIQTAPAHKRGAAIVDVLSIVTGLLDWRYAAQQGKNPREQRFVSWAAGVASGLAKQAIKSAAAIGQGNQDALSTLFDLMLMAVQLNNQMQHTRAQQGSEHYLAHILEGVTSFEVPHAALVGQCLLFSSVLHGQDPAPMRAAMEQAGVPLNRIRSTDFALVMQHLDAYLDVYEFPYSILNELDLESDEFAKALETAGLEIAPDTWEQPSEAAAEDLDDEFAVDLALTMDAIEEAEEEALAASDEEAEAAVDDDAGDDAEAADEDVDEDGDENGDDAEVLPF